MDIGEKHARVLLDLSDVEAVSCVLPIRRDSSLEWSLETADAISWTFTLTYGVRKGKAMGRSQCSS